MKYDFSGWATRNNLKCSDGRTIRKDAFKHNDGQVVPLVWNHQHNDPLNVLGHALLENRNEGVYVYGTFNDTDAGRNAKMLVKHNDVSALSIWANQLKQQGGDVFHGAIREVSLVLSGANPGAFIDSVIAHGEASDEEAIIYTGEDIMVNDNYNNYEMMHAESEETVADVFETLSEKQKNVVYALIGQALESAENDDDDEVEHYGTGGEYMKHNLFDQDYEEQNDFLSHAETEAVFADAKRYGSLRDSVLAHGIEHIDYLFPEAKTLTDTPNLISREMGWVKGVMGGVKHSPFSRIKSVHANITEDDARAKGYIKGKEKKEEVFALLKRSTTPTTIYKKQKIDRDDLVDITDFDTVSWLKAEMRLMLDEEIARAILVGDGRLSSSDDKINEQNIRPIWKDDSLYTIKTKVQVADVDKGKADVVAKAFIRAAVKSRKAYKGSGEPTLYTTEDVLTDLLLMEDSTGRVIYETVDKLRNALRVKAIETVPVMEELTRTEAGKTNQLMGIIVNLRDYNIGADKGGEVNMFDDFDIDYNAQKYLIETRCSGALTLPYSAIALEMEVAKPVPGVGG